MPELNKATSVKRAPKGFRTIKMTVPATVYALLTKIAEAESRTPDQQAAHFLRLKLSEVMDERMDQEQLDRANGRTPLETAEVTAAEVE